MGLFEFLSQVIDLPATQVGEDRADYLPKTGVALFDVDVVPRLLLTALGVQPLHQVTLSGPDPARYQEVVVDPRYGRLEAPKEYVIGDQCPLVAVLCGFFDLCWLVGSKKK